MKQLLPALSIAAAVVLALAGKVWAQTPGGGNLGAGTAPNQTAPLEKNGLVPITEEDPEPDPMAFVAIEKEPQAINEDSVMAAIGYPPAAKEAGISGKVVIRILLSKGGTYEKHVIIRSPHPILTEAVLAHIRSLRFTPAIQAGKPIRIWVTRAFPFQKQASN